MAYAGHMLMESSSSNVLVLEGKVRVSETHTQDHTRRTRIDDIKEWMVQQGPTKHIIGHIRTGFYGSMTQPTVSKHWRKIGSKDQASIPSGQPHHAHNNTTMQYETKTHKIHTDEHKWIYAQWNGSSMTKPNLANCKNCSSKCAYDAIRPTTINIAIRLSPATQRSCYDVKGSSRSCFFQKKRVIISVESEMRRRGRRRQASKKEWMNEKI